MGGLNLPIPLIEIGLMYLKIEDIFSIMNLEVDLISVCQPFTTLAIANSCMKNRESASLYYALI